MRKTYLFLLFLFYVGLSASFAQNNTGKGVPMLHTFNPTAFGNSGKIWDIEVSKNGMAFFASDKGLLRFDGKNWSNFRGSNGFTRSLSIASDSLIYSGSDMDFGAWKTTQNHDFTYSSLYPFKDEVQDENEEFWGTYFHNESVVYVSSQNLYFYKNEQLTRIGAPGKFNRSFSNENDIYLNDSRDGLYKFENLNLKQVAKYPDGISFDVVGVYKYNDQAIAVSMDAGLFRIADQQFIPFQSDLSKILQQARVFSFADLKNGWLAFGTILNGLYITDLDGNIIHHINRSKGLLNNTILSLHFSSQNHLWMGLDYGLAMLDFSHPYTYLLDNSGNYGTAYSACLKDNIFYVATNQGLYKTEWQKLDDKFENFDFQLIPGTEGQVWTVKQIADQVIIGHDKGLFMLQQDKAVQIGFEPGVWTVLPFKDYLLAGSYNGISVFQKTNGQWSFKQKVAYIAGSCNQIFTENDSILWVNIPTFGVIRTAIDEQFNAEKRSVFAENRFLGKDIFLEHDASGISIATDQMVYRYDNELHQFDSGSISKRSKQLINALSPVFEPSRINDEFIFHPVHNGFALEQLQRKSMIEGSAELAIVLLHLEAINNLESKKIEEGQKIPWGLNNIRLEYIVPNASNVRYQHRLDDAAEWSDWSTENSVLLLNMGHGKHQIFIRAAINDKMFPVRQIEFSIGAPWYFSWYALAAYFILLAAMVYSLYYGYRFKLLKQKKQHLMREREALRQLNEKHRQELAYIEQGRLQLENDALKKQLKNKTIDLASKARENEEKNKLLTSLQEKCTEAQTNPSRANVLWKEMYRMIESNMKTDDSTFDIQMNELHQEFFKKLKQVYPSLSNNDLRLCAYLKIGMNSKEIADFMHIQPSSSYISRSRLRKKLGLNPDENLYDFLNRF